MSRTATGSDFREGQLVPVTPHPSHEGVSRIAPAPEGARARLADLAWADVHPGGWAPPDPCQPQRIVVRWVFYCRAVCRDRDAAEGFPWPGSPRGWVELGGRSSGLRLAAAVFLLGGDARYAALAPASRPALRAPQRRWVPALTPAPFAWAARR